MFRVKDLTRSYLSHLDVRVKLGEIEPATKSWYKSQLDKLDVACGEYPAADLRAPHLVAVDFTYHFVRALKALYRWAVDEEQQLVPRDPFKKLKAPPCGERQRILTRAEMRSLYLASGRQLRRLLFLLRHTVARPGEIRRLTWGLIQWDRRMILWTKFKGKKRRGDGVKVRTIPLDLPAVRLLRNLYRRRGSPGPNEPVWLDRDGKELSPNGLRCRMRLARLKAGLNPEDIEERIVCYTLRHTAATDAVRAGVRGKQLSNIMGHARSATTDRYVHLAGDDLVEGIDRLAAARPRRRSSG
ncbi:tyrosine-type recombinase/integrase [bacterium]|nr:tyrosine-type recombinase/integrase [bacterium]